MFSKLKTNTKNKCSKTIFICFGGYDTFVIYRSDCYGKRAEIMIFIGTVFLRIDAKLKLIVGRGSVPFVIF